MRPTIGQRVEIDLFGISTPAGSMSGATVASGTIVGLAPGTITVRLDGDEAEVTIGPSRLLDFC
jgi:hypothetical protein